MGGCHGPSVPAPATNQRWASGSTTNDVAIFWESHAEISVMINDTAIRAFCAFGVVLVCASTYDVSQAVIANQVWTQALKFSIRRTRPDHSDRLSFPSGHASNAFAAVDREQDRSRTRGGMPLA